jgi:hypothetical protein
LIALAAAVFLLGWAQLAVAPGRVAVLRSKTGGVHPLVIRHGEFQWLWERLLPTNATMLEFSLERAARPLSVVGELPSASLYAAFLDDAADFSYRIEGVVSFLPRAESLPSLTASGQIADQASLASWMEREAAAVADFAVRRVLSYAEDAGELERLSVASANPRLIADIERTFPHIEHVSCAFTSVHLPDFELYEIAKALYREYSETKRSALARRADDAAAATVQASLRFEELERYGELLSRYPVLLKYLAIEAGAGERTLELLKNLED